MDDELKWFIAAILVILSVPMVGMVLSDYHKSNCRIELARAGKTAQEIVDVCK
jgi:hypothetical protein